MDIIKLNPIFKDYLWGGNRLKTQLNKQTDLDIVAESWEISTHKDGICTVDSFNEPLTAFLADHPDFLGDDLKQLPILVKFIDAKSSLSLQVHPDEQYAQIHENDHGKTEMWYIMDCQPDSFIYYGVNKDLTQQQFKEAIQNNTILPLLNKVNVKKGDYFLIEAGTLHAIGAGILICEIQQNSNSTYRVFDYNRKDKDGNLRPLHIDKAVDVTLLHPVKDAQSGNVGGQDKLMVDCPLFSCTYYNVDKVKDIDFEKERFKAVIMLSGKGTIACDTETLPFEKGDSFLVSAHCRKLTVSSQAEFILVK
ncbi:MAG: type I phosphomannose isomerase catalytic subunit [Erysipelotrichaceae bacterium]